MKKRRIGGFLAVGLAVAFAIALFASPFASSSPDGMSRVAINEGFHTTEKTSPVEENSPVGGYSVTGIGDERVSTGLAGALGVAATFAVASGAFLGLRAMRSRSHSATRDAEVV